MKLSISTKAKEQLIERAEKSGKKSIRIILQGYG